MVALSEKLCRNDTRPRDGRVCRRQFAPSAGIPVRCTADMLPARCRHDKCGAIVEAYDCDAYGNTLIFTAPGADGIWFTDDDVQSNYGANEIIYCGYRFDPETELYYVRNRTYNPALGRWIQRDPIGYAGGVNLYGYVGGMASAAVDAVGMAGHGPPPLPFPNLFSASTLYSGSLQDVFGPNFPVSASLKATLNSVSQFRPLWPVSSSNSNPQLQAVGVITLDGVSLTGTAGPTSGNKTLVKGEISTTIKASQGTFTPSFTLGYPDIIKGLPTLTGAIKFAGPGGKYDFSTSAAVTGPLVTYATNIQYQIFKLNDTTVGMTGGFQAVSGGRLATAQGTFGLLAKFRLNKFCYFQGNITSSRAVVGSDQTKVTATFDFVVGGSK